MAHLQAAKKHAQPHAHQGLHNRVKEHRQASLRKKGRLPWQPALFRFLRNQAGLVGAAQLVEVVRVLATRFIGVVVRTRRRALVAALAAAGLRVLFMLAIAKRVAHAGAAVARLAAAAKIIAVRGRRGVTATRGYAAAAGLGLALLAGRRAVARGTPGALALAVIGIITILRMWLVVEGRAAGLAAMLPFRMLMLLVFFAAPA